jgi:hypothetical protein
MRAYGAATLIGVYRFAIDTGHSSLHLRSPRDHVGKSSSVRNGGTYQARCFGLSQRET